MDNLATVLRYHHETKHHFGRYARSLGYLDWVTQPAPFRRFTGCATFPLPVPHSTGDEAAEGPLWDALPHDPPAPAALNGHTLAHFLYHSLALAAWKEVVSPEGEVVSRWALRVNPSSGNLHPTEAYVLADTIAGVKIQPGCLHYAPDQHLLEQRVTTGPFGFLPDDHFLVMLNSIPWREMWKYGERAYRYCNHDVGHALLALSAAAACLGWRATLVPGVSPAALARLTGAAGQDGPEREHPDCAVLVGPGAQEPDLLPGLPDALDQLAMEIQCHGQPNTLSSRHQDWPLVGQVAEACQEPVTGVDRSPPAGAPPTELFPRPARALPLIRGRRSAVAMDGTTTMPADHFQRLCRALDPDNPLLRSITPAGAHLSLLLFVHRVDGLEPGVYLLIRHPEHLSSLRQASSLPGDWPAADPGPAGLHRIVTADCRAATGRLCCGQAIAADGALAVGMLAHFRSGLERYGAGFYRQLFWEAGALGQILYLEAEAAGLSGTGIGCYFDDEVHKLLGLEDDTWQSLYHFTLGGAVADTRLRSAAPYAHLTDGR